MKRLIIVKLVDLAVVVAGLEREGVAYSAEPRKFSEDLYEIYITGC